MSEESSSSHRKRQSKDSREGDSSKRSRSSGYVCVSRKFYDLIPLYTQPPVHNGTSVCGASKEILDYFKKCLPSESEIRHKFDIWCELLQIFSLKDPEAVIMIYGSTLSGLARNGSDLDVCVLSDSFKGNNISLLSSLRKWMKKRRSLRTSAMSLIPAKVPILKLTGSLRDWRGPWVDVDVSCNDTTGIRNSYLIFAYTKLDPRFKPLYCVLKAWASNEDINDAKNFSLSSFTLILMLIHFLQAAVSPPVLPVLQVSLPSTFPSSDLSPREVLRLPFTTCPDLNFSSANRSSLRELLDEFFVYYATKFDFSRDVGSVRTGKRLDARECIDWATTHRAIPRQWNANVLMEEPFNRSNAARATINRPKFMDILRALQNGHQVLVSEKGSLSQFLSQK